jgi:hypothetical protein
MTATSAHAVPPTNYDEAKVGDYTLPDPLLNADGTRVTSAEDWRQRRRAEVLDLFETHMYGRILPPRPQRAQVLEKSGNALGGKATRLQVAIEFDSMPGVRLNLLLYLPNVHDGPVPCFLGLNFFGNAAASNETEVFMTDAWMREAPHVKDHRLTPASRGVQAARWPAEQIIDAGFAMATVYYGDIDPDFDDGFKNGVHPFFHDPAKPRSLDDAASIGAWAWGLSRTMDFLQTLTEIDPRRVCLTGHSRLGKTALWAGATDERFALVVSNSAGCGGPALSRRNFGESLAVMTRAFPHWLCTRAQQMAFTPDQFPLDQHMLVALIAPRPVFVSSKSEDLWCDPKGEFLGAMHADSVYRLLTGQGCDAKQMPAVDEAVMSRIGYLLRPGPHEITPEDWAVHLAFAKRHLASL